MKKNIFNTLCLTAALTVLAPAAHSQTAEFLNINPDPVSMSMAGTGASMEATSFAMWNNAAAAVLGEETLQVGAAYSLWQPTVSPSHFAAVSGYGKVASFMTVSAGVKYVAHNSMDLTDGTSGAVLSSFTPMELQAGVGVGFRILPILSLGANVNYVFSDIGGTKKGGAVAADFGALLDLKFLRVGLTASNIGSKLDYGGTSAWSLPANAKLGVGTVQDLGADKKHSIVVNLEGGITFEETAFFAGLGAQYCYNNLLRVAAGYRYAPENKPVIGSYASVGVGVLLKGISIDATYLIGTSKDSPLGNTFSVGLGYRF